MSRTIESTGTTLGQALTVAVAELLDCEPGEVAVRIEGPGSDELQGAFRLDLTVAPEPPDLEEPEDEREPEQAVAAPTARRDRDGEEDGVDDQVVLTAEDLDAEADAAADFMEGLLDALDLPGDLRIRLHEDHAELEVVDIGSGALIGRRGQTLEAIQELLRCSLQRQFQRRARVKIDAEGYRARRMEKLIEKTEEAIDSVLENGEPERLEPMDVFERKAVHRLVSEVDGLVSRSQGREPGRRVVIEQE